MKTKLIQVAEKLHEFFHSELGRLLDDCISCEGLTEVDEGCLIIPESSLERVIEDSVAVFVELEEVIQSRYMSLSSEIVEIVESNGD